MSHNKQPNVVINTQQKTTTLINNTPFINNNTIYFSFLILLRVSLSLFPSHIVLCSRAKIDKADNRFCNKSVSLLSFLSAIVSCLFSCRQDQGREWSSRLAKVVAPSPFGISPCARGAHRGCVGKLAVHRLTRRVYCMCVGVSVRMCVSVPASATEWDRESLLWESSAL